MSESQTTSNTILLTPALRDGNAPQTFRTSSLDDNAKASILNLTLQEPVIVFADHQTSPNEDKAFGNVPATTSIGEPCFLLRPVTRRLKASHSAPSYTQLQLLQHLSPTLPWSFLLPKTDDILRDTLRESHSVCTSPWRCIRLLMI